MTSIVRTEVLSIECAWFFKGISASVEFECPPLSPRGRQHDIFCIFAHHLKSESWLTDCEHQRSSKIFEWTPSSDKWWGKNILENSGVSASCRLFSNVLVMNLSTRSTNITMDLGGRKCSKRYRVVAASFDPHPQPLRIGDVGSNPHQRRYFSRFSSIQEIFINWPPTSSKC